VSVPLLKSINHWYKKKTMQWQQMLTVLMGDALWFIKIKRPAQQNPNLMK